LLCQNISINHEYFIPKIIKMIRELAIDLISQYGDDAETIAMMKAAEYAALLDNENWQLWENVIEMLEVLNSAKSLDS